MRVLSPLVLISAGMLAFLLLPSEQTAPLHSARIANDMPEAAARYFWEQRSWPHGIPVRAYETAMRHVREMSVQGLRKTMAGWRWISLGPINVAGRMRALAIDPQDAAVLYAGSAGGGIWKSTNSGREWRQLDDLLPNLRIGAIAVHPTDSRRILAGCGEGYVAWQGSAAFGKGIYRSEDAGDSWVLLPATDAKPFWYVFDVDFDPFTPDVVLASTWQGVYRSSDGGNTWSSILVRSTAPFSASVEFSRTQLGVAYAALEGEGIFRSDNHGSSFRFLGKAVQDSYSRIVLAAAPSEGDIVYAAFTDHEASECAALLRSDDAGVTWRALTIPRSRLNGETYMGGQGRFNSTLAVHPTDPDRVWVGGIDLHRSTDGGATWKQMTNWYAHKDYPYVHADHHALLFNTRNPRELFAATDGGMFRSEDGGEQFAEMTAGMVTVQFHSGTPHPHSDMVIGGTIDNGTLRTLDGDRWTDVTGGDGGYTAIDPTEPRLMYGELYYLHLLKSTDFGRTFYPSMNGIPRAQDFGTSDPVAFIAPFEMSPSSPKTLYAGSNRVYRSSNGAESWTAISSDLAGSNTFITAIGLAASDENVIWVGTSRGRVQLTTNRGASWQRVDSGLPGFFVTDFAVHPANPLDVIAVFSGFGSPHAWHSTDGGERWQSIAGSGSGGLPDVPANTVLRHPENTSEIFVGTDVGLFVSTDLGATWAVDNDGMGNVTVADLRLRPDGVLFAATHGRGMYRSSRSLLGNTTAVPLDSWLGQNYPNPVTSASGSETVIPYSLSSAGRVQLCVTDMAGRLVRERSFGWQDAGDYRFPFDTRALSSGAYVIQLFFNGALSGERTMMRTR